MRTSWAVRLGQRADVGQGESYDSIVTTGHLGPNHLAGSLSRREPGEIQGVVRWDAVAGDTYDERQTHGMLARVVETRHQRIGEVLHHGERCW